MPPVTLECWEHGHAQAILSNNYFGRTCLKNFLSREVTRSWAVSGKPTQLVLYFRQGPGSRLGQRPGQQFPADICLAPVPCSEGEENALADHTAGLCGHIPPSLPNGVQERVLKSALELCFRETSHRHLGPLHTPSTRVRRAGQL